MAAENGAVTVGDDDDEDEEEGEDFEDAAEVDANDANLHSEPHRDRSAKEMIKTSSGRKSRQSGLDAVDRQSALVHAPVKETEVLPPGMLRRSSNEDDNEDESQSQDRKRKKRKAKMGPDDEVLDSGQSKVEKERRSKRKRKSEVVES